MLKVVINTGPIIALVAATDSLDFLANLYDQVLIPHEVDREILAGGVDTPEHQILRSAPAFIQILPPVKAMPSGLANQLDSGEASVIANAQQLHLPLVAIDERVGRRVARLHGLSVTGSLGILVKAKRQGRIDDLGSCIKKMHAKGIWISDTLIRQALATVGEPPNRPS